MSQSRLGAALVLVAALIFSASATAAGGPRVAALELPGKRTATSSTYLNPDGTFTTEVASAPVNFRDASGSWQPIDTHLVASSDSDYAYENAAGPFKARFKATAGDGFVQFSSDGQSYALGLKGAGKSSAHAHGNTVDYAGALPGTTVAYRVLSTGIKETMTLADAHGPAKFDYVLAGADDLVATTRTDGAVSFSAPGAARPVFVLSSPWAADTVDGRVVHANETHPALTVHKTGNGTYDISVTVDRAWLNSSARQFPVVVDPTITIGAAQDAEFEMSCASAPCQTRDDDPMSIGGDDSSTYAVGVQFDLSAVPADATVTSSTLGLHFDGQCGWTSANGFGCAPVSHTIDALRMTAPWSEGSVTAQTPPSQLAYDPAVVSAATIAAGAPAGFVSWDLTALTQSWASHATPNNGVLLKHDPQAVGTGAPTFESSEDYDATLQPRLDVTYSGGTTPPPSTPSYGQTIVADGPIGYWKLGDLGTTTAADSSGLGHPGDYSGTYLLGQPGLLTHSSDTAVTFRNASFDGRMLTQYLYGYAGSAVTAETWVNYAGATGVDQLVSRGYASNGGWSLGLTRTSGIQQAQFTIVKGGARYTATANVTPGTLYLAGSYDGSTVRLYVNGALAASRAVAAAPLTATANTLLAGTLVDDVTLDESAVYDHALSAAQVQSHYAAGLK